VALQAKDKAEREAQAQVVAAKEKLAATNADLEHRNEDLEKALGEKESARLLAKWAQGKAAANAKKARQYAREIERTANELRKQQEKDQLRIKQLEAQGSIVIKLQ
jgi:hypothetical protein